MNRNTGIMSSDESCSSTLPEESLESVSSSPNRLTVPPPSPEENFRPADSSPDELNASSETTTPESQTGSNFSVGPGSPRDRMQRVIRLVRYSTNWNVGSRSSTSDDSTVEALRLQLNEMRLQTDDTENGEEIDKVEATERFTSTEEDCKASGSAENWKTKKDDEDDDNDNKDDFNGGYRMVTIIIDKC